VDRLPVLKALADDSRYAIFMEMSRAAVELSTFEVAARLDLHPNTVRLHLERLREVGLVEQSARSHGAVGRPQHHWVVAAGAPSLGFEPSGWRLLAHLMAEVAAGGGSAESVGRAAGLGLVSTASRAGPGPVSTASGAGPGRPPPGGPRPPAAPGSQPPGDPGPRILEELTGLGFEPVVESGTPGGGGGVCSVAFTRCPFRTMAEAYPDIVCRLHHGITRGLAEGVSADLATGRVAVTAFAGLVDVGPCRVELTTADGGPPG
jgi:predicted ArsR family transcriptional regulator